MQLFTLTVSFHWTNLEFIILNHTRFVKNQLWPIRPLHLATTTLIAQKHAWALNMQWYGKSTNTKLITFDFKTEFWQSVRRRLATPFLLCGEDYGMSGALLKAIQSLHSSEETLFCFAGNKSHLSLVVLDSAVLYVLSSDQKNEDRRFWFFQRIKLWFVFLLVRFVCVDVSTVIALGRGPKQLHQDHLLQTVSVWLLWWFLYGRNVTQCTFQNWAKKLPLATHALHSGK